MNFFKCIFVVQIECTIEKKGSFVRVSVVGGMGLSETFSFSDGYFFILIAV